jgi:hypothetical protein
MAAPKAKRSKTEAEDTVDDEDIQVLEGIQDQIEELNDKATEEILEVERKYNRLRKPIYEKRAEAIRKLPEFWFKVVSFCVCNTIACCDMYFSCYLLPSIKFTGQDMLAALLVGEDLAAFKYMKELNVEDHDDVKSGFKISLVCMSLNIVQHIRLMLFTRNSTPTRSSRTKCFLKSSAMIKKVTLLLSQQKLIGKKERYKIVPTLTLLYTQQAPYLFCLACFMYPSYFFRLAHTSLQDLTKKAQSKDVKGKRSRDDESESFFTWFNPDDQDLELAEIIKEELWPNPAKYFLGVCVPLSLLFPKSPPIFSYSLKRP